MKDLIVGFKVLLNLTVVTGVLYPGIISAYTLVVVNKEAHGNLIKVENKVIGSELLSQEFTRPEYFWSRPSAVNHNSSLSGASNLSPTSEILKKQYEERSKALLASYPDFHGNLPQDLLFASGSGLDPHITPEAAIFQSLRIAKARNISKDTVHSLIAQMTEKRQFGILGEPRVNVLKLNRALDEMKWKH